MTRLQFMEIWEIVVQKENYVKRENPTIGGRWCTETWYSCGWIARLMDEGYTKQLFHPQTLQRFTLTFDNVIKED